LNKIDNCSVSMRKFPYPYRAAVSICSDIDDCDRNTFISVHKALNDENGRLGLPVSDSFFPVGWNSDQMAYYLPDGRSHSPDASFIRDAVRVGLIDSIHSWGDFNKAPPDPVFLRKLARNFVTEFHEHDLKLRVWINHGSPNNRQNMKSRIADEYQGDNPESQYYTSDLLPELGVKFYWWSEVVSYPLSCASEMTLLNVTKIAGGKAIKNIVKRLIGRGTKTRSFSQLTELIHPTVLRDNSKIVGFTRFNRHPGGVWHLPSRDTLRFALNRQVLDKLIALKGNLILYTHLGLPVKRATLFQKPDMDALVYLSALYHNGTVWVTPTSKLLTYQMVKKYLEWETMMENGRTVINLISIDDPVLGPRSLEKEDLFGLCFYTMHPDLTSIQVNGATLSAEVYLPDETGIASIGFKSQFNPSVDFLRN